MKRLKDEHSRTIADVDKAAKDPDQTDLRHHLEIQRKTAMKMLETNQELHGYLRRLNPPNVCTKPPPTMEETEVDMEEITDKLNKLRTARCLGSGVNNYHVWRETCFRKFLVSSVILFMQNMREEAARRSITLAKEVEKEIEKKIGVVHITDNQPHLLVGYYLAHEHRVKTIVYATTAIILV